MAEKGSTVIGAETLAKNILVFENKFLDEVNKDMNRVEKLLDKAVTRNISLRDHSLDELAAMGHPYSVRAYRQLHEPAYQVHTQSGELKRGKISGTEEAEVVGGRLSASAWVGIADYVEHAKYVIFGTSVMVPRPFLEGSLNEVKEQALELLRRSLKNTVVNFHGQRIQL